MLCPDSSDSSSAVSKLQPPVLKSNTQRWASLADRLNPNRPAFDPRLKASWKTMSKSERKRIISEDRKAIQALKSRGSSNPLPFQADPDDHCETSPVAYTHIVPLLKFIASASRKKPSDLEIYDPYYCAGGTVRHLNKLGFQNVYNECKDFYEVIAKKHVPSHDVVLTNPPYSGGHFDKLLKFLSENDKPALLLLPEHFSEKKSPLYSPDKFCHLTPPKRYHYWTPEGMRPEQQAKKRKQHKNLMLGSRSSPFASYWFINMEPIVTNSLFVSLVHRGEIKLVDGCRVHSEQVNILPTTFKGAIQNSGEKNDRRKKRRRSRNKEKSTAEIARSRGTSSCSDTTANK